MTAATVSSTCPTCNYPLQPAWNSCPNCGRNVKQAAGTQELRLPCPTCGSYMTIHDDRAQLVCPKCHSLLIVRQGTGARTLEAVRANVAAPESPLGEVIRDELLRRDNRRDSERARRSSDRAMESSSKEGLGLFVSCISVFALLLGLGPALAFGTLGWTALGGAAFAAALTVFVDLRRGWTVGKSLLRIGFIGGLTFSMIVGVFMYFSSLASNPNAFVFMAVPTKVAGGH